MRKKNRNRGSEGIAAGEAQAHTAAVGFVVFDQEEAGWSGTHAEDLLLRAFSDLDQRKHGFYVDIGAYHPNKASNTKFFYDLGWSGLNIDPNPASIEEFNRDRPRDTNLTIGVSDVAEELDYYFFGESHTINTFDRNTAEKFKEVFNLKIQKVIKVPVVPINEVLAEHVPGGQKIDFMSIDVEGFEMRILKALDFDSFGPEYLLIEDLDHEGLNATDQEVLHIKDSDQNRFMESRGYKLLGKTAQTLLYSKNAG